MHFARTYLKEHTAEDIRDVALNNFREGTAHGLQNGIQKVQSRHLLHTIHLQNIQIGKINGDYLRVIAICYTIEIHSTLDLPD